MATNAERLASSMNWGAFGKAEELKKRLLFTLFALIIYRLGTHIPLPGINPDLFRELFFNSQRGGILGMFDMFAGGGLSRMSIFALNIIPYISASIIVQLMTAVSPHLEALKKEGEAGRKVINQYTRYGTVMLALVQSYAIAFGLQSSPQTAAAVTLPGFLFILTAVVSLTSGTVFLMWMGEQITARGIGNGTSLIIYTGIVATIPSSLAQLFETMTTGSQGPSTYTLLGYFVLVVAVIIFVVFMERAQRRVPVQYPKRQMGNRMMGGETSHLPLKLNVSGVIPPIFASSLLLLPATIGQMGIGRDIPWFTDMMTALAHGKPLYMILYGAMIVFFAFFYTAIVFNPTETADNLKKYGGFVPGVRPGTQTAEYFDQVLTRLTLVGALYLALVCLLPEFLITQQALPIMMGGTSLLIVVSVTMDTVTQIQSHLIAHQYEGLLKKNKLGLLRGA